MMKDYENMTNNEIKLDMQSLENEYEATKVKAMELINRMKELYEQYIEAKNELDKRSSIKW